MRGRSTGALLVCAWALLMGAWVIGNPPFEAPDEPDHYIRAVGIAQGDIIGHAVPQAQIGASSRQIARTRQEARGVLVPRGLAPPNCVRDPASRPVRCGFAADNMTAPAGRFTVVGAYQPLPYLAPAALLERGNRASTALRWSRAAAALTGLFFLALAVALVAVRARPESLLGVTAAVTPMVLYMSSSVNASGLEIASGVAFFAGLMALTRADPPPAWAWLGTGLAAAALAASRSPGPLWLLLGAALAVGLLGARPAWRRVVTAGPVAWAGTALAAAGVIVNRLWDAAHGAENHLATFALGAGLRAGIDEWWRASSGLVGRFGHLEYPLPSWIILGWLAVVAALGVFAWRGCERRDRMLLTAVGLVCAAFPYFFYVFLLRDTGFGLQGRHVLPVLVAAPLLAGELAYRREAISRRTVVVVPAILALLQFVSFYFSSRRYAVGTDGPLMFLGDDRWAPPTGWWPVLALALLGAAALASAGLTAARRS